MWGINWGNAYDGEGFASSISLLPQAPPLAPLTPHSSSHKISPLASPLLRCLLHPRILIHRWSQVSPRSNSCSNSQLNSPLVSLLDPFFPWWNSTFPICAFLYPGKAFWSRRTSCPAGCTVPVVFSISLEPLSGLGFPAQLNLYVYPTSYPSN